MAELFPNPRLPLNVVHLSYPSLHVNGRPVSVEQIREWYERGHLILLEGFRLDCDLERFATLKTDSEDAAGEGSLPRQLPKKFERLPSGTGISARFRALLDPRRALLLREMRRVRRQLLEIARRLFPVYEFLDQKITWRLTEQVNETMHIDVYPSEVPTHQLRIFANLDIGKRIWNIGYDIDSVFEKGIGNVGREKLEASTVGEISAYVNAKTFGTRHTRGAGDHPCCLAMFEPGEVWIVESRQVAHQVLYGRRAVSTDIAVGLDSMKYPERHYLEVSRRYIERRRGELGI